MSMGFSRQEYRSGLPFLSPRDPPNPGIEPASPALASRLLITWGNFCRVVQNRYRLLKETSRALFLSCYPLAPESTSHCGECIPPHSLRPPNSPLPAERSHGVTLLVFTHRYILWVPKRQLQSDTSVAITYHIHTQQNIMILKGMHESSELMKCVSSTLPVIHPGSTPLPRNPLQHYGGSALNEVKQKL